MADFGYADTLTLSIVLAQLPADTPIVVTPQVPPPTGEDGARVEFMVARRNMVVTLDATDPTPFPIPPTPVRRKVKVIAQRFLNIREGPSKDTADIGDLAFGRIVEIVGDAVNGYLKLWNGAGWIAAEWVVAA